MFRSQYLVFLNDLGGIEGFYGGQMIKIKIGFWNDICYNVNVEYIALEDI